MGGRKKIIPDSFTLDKTGVLCDVKFVILASIVTGTTRASLTDMFPCGDGWVDGQIREIFSKLDIKYIEGAIDKAWSMGIFTIDNRVTNPTWKTLCFKPAGKQKEKQP